MYISKEGLEYNIIKYNRMEYLNLFSWNLKKTNLLFKINLFAVLLFPKHYLDLNIYDKVIGQGKILMGTFGGGEGNNLISLGLNLK